MIFNAYRHEHSLQYQITGSRYKVFILCSFFFVFCSMLFAQPHYTAGGRDDSEAAQQYFKWAQQALNEGRRKEAFAALKRASDFSNVSSDISYLLGVTRLSFLSEGETRKTVLKDINAAIETNKWVNYNQNQALCLKTEMLIAMREYVYALECLDKIPESETSADMTADAVMLRLLALRGMAAQGDVYAPAQFRSRVLSAMDRFSRDPRPLRIFFEYAHNRKPLSGFNFQFQGENELTESDRQLMELVLRRLPFLLETDSELAWMAAPFMRNLEDARRIVSAYRAGGIYNIRNRDFMPHPASIAAALNLGLLDDIAAVNELFSGSRGFNYPQPSEIAPDGNPVLDIKIVNGVFDLLRSEEGREYFTKKILSFTGSIISDDDHDRYIDTCAFIDTGVIKSFSYDVNQDASYDLQIIFSADGSPVSAVSPAPGLEDTAHIKWERYPYVRNVKLNNEEFEFRPADFQFTPVSFIQVGGSGNMYGLLFPVLERLNIDLTRRALVFACSLLSRPSVEIEKGTETFYMEKGIPLKAVEVLNGESASVTEFERGFPVIQYIDLDLDGRKETIRRFRRISSWNEMDFIDYRKLLASSESDWEGNGKFTTREVYLPDGSVVYSFDMDGSGAQTYSETGKQ